jgi:hypothetical protein
MGFVVAALQPPPSRIGKEKIQFAYLRQGLWSIVRLNQLNPALDRLLL